MLICSIILKSFFNKKIITMWRLFDRVLLLWRIKRKLNQMLFKCNNHVKNLWEANIFLLVHIPVFWENLRINL